MLKTINWDSLNSVYAVLEGSHSSPEGQWASTSPTPNPNTGRVLRFDVGVICFHSVNTYVIPALITVSALEVGPLDSH